jgi:hypothetical protein
MISTQYGGNLEMISVAFASLFLLVFGIAFNAWVEKHEDDAPIFVSIWVAVGVFVTLAAAFVVEVSGAVDLPGTVIAFFGFVFSGSPMVAGSLGRYAKHQADERDIERERARLERERNHG